MEREYIIPLRKEVMKKPRYKRTKKAVITVRNFLRKHMKVQDVKLGPDLNKELWKHGIKNPPMKIKVRAVKKDDMVYANLIGKPIPLDEVKDEKKGKVKKEEKSQAKKTEEAKKEVKEEKKEEVKEEKKEEVKEEKKEVIVEKKEEPVVKKEEEIQLPQSDKPDLPPTPQQILDDLHKQQIEKNKTKAKEEDEEIKKLKEQKEIKDVERITEEIKKKHIKKQ